MQWISLCPILCLYAFLHITIKTYTRLCFNIYSHEEFLIFQYLASHSRLVWPESTKVSLYHATFWYIKEKFEYAIEVLSIRTSVQFIQSCPTLCDPMNCSMPGLPVHHQLPEFTQTHIHRVSEAIQPSHPLSSPSPPAPNLSQHQSLFQWVNSSPEAAKVLEFQL